MKKVLIAVAALAMVFGVNAASVDWQVTGTAATENYIVYLVSSVATSYSTVADIATSAIDSATIAKKGTGTRATYTTGTKNSTNEKLSKTGDYYYVIVSGEDATTFNYVEAAGLASKVYDTSAQESSPGTFNTINAAGILAGSSGTIGSVPEPTSGLLLLVGMAGLALRRKQK